MLTEPWAFYDTGGGAGGWQMRGILPEIVALIEAESGVPLRTRLVPYTRIWQELEDGDTDMSFLLRSPDREGIVSHAAHMFDLGFVVIARRGVSLNGYDDLQGLRIGVLRGIRLSPRFDADTSLHKVPGHDYETMVAMLNESRLDAVAGNSVSLSYLLAKQNMRGLADKRLVLQVTPVTVHVSRHFKNAQVERKIGEAVERLKRRGAFEEIIDRWAGTSWRVP